MRSIERQSPDPNAGPAPGEDAIEKAAAALLAAATTEEARFNNLNTRAVSLIGAGSIVVALLAVFGKDLVTGDNTVPSRAPLTFLLVLAVATLLMAVGWLVFGVLIPGKRYTFGDNRITNNDPKLTTATQVFEVQWREYRIILQRLTERNAKKARALHVAYVAYGIAVASAVLAVALVMIVDRVVS